MCLLVYEYVDVYGRMVGRTDGRAGGRADGWTVGGRDGRTDDRSDGRKMQRRSFLACSLKMHLCVLDACHRYIVSRQSLMFGCAANIQ